MPLLNTAETAPAVLFAVIMAVPVLGRFGFGLNSVIAFWFAYIVTRPLGASAADWLGKPVRAGGVGFGDGPVAAVLLSLIVTLVTCVAVRRHINHISVKGSPA
jgi:uncharacterized membrane-anchored protein